MAKMLCVREPPMLMSAPFRHSMSSFRLLFMALDSTAEAYKLYIRPDDIMYPSTHTKYELPDVRPKNLKTEELLHQRYHIKDKIKWLVKLKRECRREAVIAMKRRRKDDMECLNGADISMGGSRTHNIFAINRSIAYNWTLLSQVEDQIKVRFESNKCNSELIFNDEEQAGQIIEPSIVARPTRQSGDSTHDRVDTMHDLIGLLQVLVKRREMHRAVNRSRPPFFRNYDVNALSDGSRGDPRSPIGLHTTRWVGMSQLQLKTATADRRLNNIWDTKLELILQFI